jgi:hypothetical protein
LSMTPTVGRSQSLISEADQSSFFSARNFDN